MSAIGRPVSPMLMETVTISLSGGTSLKQREHFPSLCYIRSPLAITISKVDSASRLRLVHESISVSRNMPNKGQERI